jgi:hypothetical protein
LLLKGLNVRIPTYWKATDTPGIYKCQLPACKYRRFSYGIKSGELVVQLHCFRQQKDCIPEECQSCPLVVPDTSVRKKVKIETDNGDGTTTTTQAVMRVNPSTDLNLLGLGTWRPVQNAAPEGPPVARPDLQAIQDLLPPHKPGRDRKFHIDEDGTIVYEKEESEWEPPREINGYQHDPQDSWRFTPLWKPCALRHVVAVRYANCGCIGVIMRCNNPEAPLFVDRVSHTDCASCPKRVPWETQHGLPKLP